MTVIYVTSGLLCIMLVGYLLSALIKPERF
jgi:K+-transporting ATPase KdpF subunit